MFDLKNLIKLAAATTLINGSAIAKENQNLVVDNSTVDSVTKVEFLLNPQDASLQMQKTPQLKRDLSDEYRTNNISKIKYNFTDGIEADLGLVKTTNAKIKFKTRSAALPRGRYFKPINSKLGAKLSTKF